MIPTISQANASKEQPLIERIVQIAVDSYYIGCMQYAGQGKVLKGKRLSLTSAYCTRHALDYQETLKRALIKHNEGDTDEEDTAVASIRKLNLQYLPSRH